LTEDYFPLWLFPPDSLMATANTVSTEQTTATAMRADLLVFIAPMAPEQLESILGNLAMEFRGDELLVATANDPTGTAHSEIRIHPVQATNAVWPIAAVDFVNVVHAARENEAKAVLLLGPGADSLSPAALRGLVNSVAESKSDLAVPHYSLPVNAGLVNSAIIYPLTRALFASRVRFPLSIDMALSTRMAERVGATAQKAVNQNQPDAIVWPVSEAMVAGLSIDEVDVGTRDLPQPAEPNINAILSRRDQGGFCRSTGHFLPCRLWMALSISRRWWRRSGWHLRICRRSGDWCLHPIPCWD
jgi:glucosylglycerate synthase